MNVEFLKTAHFYNYNILVEMKMQERFLRAFETIGPESEKSTNTRYNNNEIQ